MKQPSRRQFLASAGAGAAALALAACSGSPSAPGAGSTDLSKNEVDAMKNFGVGTQFKAAKPLSFSIAMDSNPAYPYNAKWPFFTDLQKMTNVSLNSTVIPFADYDTKIGALINAGNAPFLIPKTYPGEETPYVAGGAILPVSDYVHLMPNFQDKVSKWGLQGDLDSLRQSDGKYYLLPGLHQQVWSDYTLAVRTDILKKLNIPTPQTWADVEAMLVKMKKAYPKLYPLSDRYNVPTPGGALLNILASAYGTAAGWGYQSPNEGAYWDASQKKFVLTGAMPQFKQMLQYLNGVYSQGLIDPESFTQTDTTAIQKFTTGKSFVITTNAQVLVSDLRSGLKISGATVEKIPVPIGPLGPVIAQNAASRLENGMMISSKAAKSPDFVAMLQFIDWLWYSDAGQLFAKWGVQGTTYTGDVNDGTFKLASDVTWGGINPNAKKNLQADFGFFNGVFAYGGSTALLDTQFPADELAFQKVMDARKADPLPPPAPLSTLDNQQVTLWGTSLMSYVQQQSLQFITGKRPLSQWDAYVSELESQKNGTKLVATIQKAYETYKQKNG